MTTLMVLAAHIVLIGVMGTAAMDTWLLLLRRLGVPTLDFALIGLWVGHLATGRFAHPRIASAAPVKRELAIGWLTHYATGVFFAGVLVVVAGSEWVTSPTLLPALSVGIATVLVPFLVMQPAMGAGIAASRTPNPGRNRLRSLANHTVFGAGLYGAALLLDWLTR